MYIYDTLQFMGHSAVCNKMFTSKMTHRKTVFVCLILAMFLQESSTWGIIDSITSGMKTVAEKVKTPAQSAIETLKSGIQSASEKVKSGAQSAFNTVKNGTQSVYYSSKDWGKALLRNTRNVKGQPAADKKRNKKIRMVDIRKVPKRKVGRKMIDMRQKSNKKAKKSLKPKDVATSTLSSVQHTSSTVQQTQPAV